MTVARLNRGKTKFIVGVVALLLVLGFVAIFQNNQQENDELRELSIRCEQQLGGMQAQSSRSSMEFKKLTADYEKRSSELEKVQADLEKLQKDFDEEKRKFETLEQESKISETHRGDEIEKLKKENSNLKNQIDRVNKEKDTEVAKLKAQLDVEEDIETVSRLKQRNVRLEQEVNRLKVKCDGGGSAGYESSSPAVRKSLPSVETNFNQQVPIIQKQIGDVEEPRGVLQQPQLLNAKASSSASSSSSSSTTTTTEAAKAANDRLNAAPNLQAPQLKGSTTKKIQIPEGVVPFPENNFLVPEEAVAVENNPRYGAVDEMNEKKDDTAKNGGDDLNFLNAHDDDNMANEIPDNDFNIDEKAKKPDAGENNAEEDTNLYDANKGIFMNPGKEGDAHKNSGDMKLRHEIIDDQGKEGENDYHNEDVHLDAQQEEGGDTDDYDVPDRNINVADPVVRN